MPTKRTRRGRHRLPSGFESVGIPELISWSTTGPTVSDDPPSSSRVTVYPDWAAWAEFYGRVREQYMASQRGPGVPAVERLYEAILAGKDPEEESAAISRDNAENDPRKAWAKQLETEGQWH